MQLGKTEPGTSRFLLSLFLFLQYPDQAWPSEGPIVVNGEVQLFALGTAIKRKFVVVHFVGAGKILARHAEGSFAAGHEIEHAAYTSATLRVGAFHLRLRAAAHENGSYQCQGSDQFDSVNDQVLHAMLRRLT
jgi:hypothetical protein